LRVARETLCTTSASVTELAQQLGYADASAFTHAFKRATGLSPLDYRRKHPAARPASGKGSRSQLLRQHKSDQDDA